MKHETFAHAEGRKFVPDDLLAEVTQTLAKVPVPDGQGIARQIRQRFLAGLKTEGWSNEVHLSQSSKCTITSSKRQIGLCLQTGNMARMYADLLKLQALYLDGVVTAAILILPSKAAAKRMGENVADADRLRGELEMFRKAFTVPTVFIALSLT